MNILLTGSTGFLGSRVMSLLKKNGHRVFCINRPMADLLKRQTLIRFKKTLPRIDRVVHLAAKVPKTAHEDTKTLYMQNIRMTQNLLDIFDAQGMIFASTIEVYGAPRTKKISERTPTQPKTWYGKSKLASERLSSTATILRFASLYGAGDTIDRAIPNFIRAALRDNDLKITGAQNKRDYLHVDDAAHAVLLAIQKNTSGVFCIGTGKPLSILTIAKTIATHINPKLKVHTTGKTHQYDLVFSIHKAQKILGFFPKYIFPDPIVELIPPPIVFDLDGTILDVSKKYHVLHKHFPKSQFVNLVEQPQYLVLDTIHPGIKDVLEGLLGKFPLFLVTLRKNRKSLLKQLKTLGLDHFFPEQRVINPKDKIHAIRSIKPRPLAVIGDTEIDVRAARALGIPSVAVTWGLRKRKILSQENPTVLLANPKKLRAIITRIYEQSHDSHPRI